MSGRTSDVDPVREVNRLHLLLQDWYNGIRDDIDPISDAMASDFTSIGPTGEIRDRRSTLEAWSQERSRIAQETPVTVAVEDVSVRRSLFGLHQVTYRREIAGNASTCDLWLRETDRVRTGLQWLHLTEVPAPADEPDE